MELKSTKWSIFNLICHEFHCVIRRQVTKGDNELEILGYLTSAKSRILKKLTTYSGILLISAIAISNLSQKQGVDFSVSGIGLIIPDAYVAFVGATAFCSLVFLSLQMVVFLYAHSQFEHSPRQKKRFIGAELSLMGDENSDITSPIRVGHFLKSDKRFTRVAIALYLIPIFAALLPLVSAITFILQESLIGLGGSNTIFAARSFSTVSIFLIIFPVLYSIIFFVPVRNYKNVKTIRWNFLVRATRGKCRLHHNATRWLKSENKQ